MPRVGAGRRLRSSMAPGECETVAAIVPCACVVMCVGVRDRAKSPWMCSLIGVGCYLRVRRLRRLEEVVGPCRS